MHLWAKLEQGERIIDTRNNDEYMYEAYDSVTDEFQIVNWFGQRSIPAVEFYKYFELDLKLPVGTHNKVLQLDKDLCDHEFVEYSGLRESFTFCKKCDKRA